MNLNGIYIKTEDNIKDTVKKDNINAFSMAERVSIFNSKKIETKINSNMFSGPKDSEFVDGTYFGDMPKNKNSIIKASPTYFLAYSEDEPNYAILCSVLKAGEID